MTQTLSCANGYKVIARATRTPVGVFATVAAEITRAEGFLGQARGPENRLEIELENGEVIRLRAKGAGRWSTTVSMLGGLLEVVRTVEGRG